MRRSIRPVDSSGVHYPQPQLVESVDFANAMKGQAPRVCGVRKTVEDVQPSVGRFVMSTSGVDRGRDVIAQDGWRLDNYNKAGRPVLWAHDSSLPPVARFASVGVESETLVGKGLEFADGEAYALARTVKSLVDGGFLKSGSVGFLPVRLAFNAERGGFDFFEQELLEFSLVPVPANPDALLRAKAAGVELLSLEEWCEKALDGESGLVLPRRMVEEAWTSITNRKTTLDALSSLAGEVEALASRVAALEQRKETAAQPPEPQGRAAAPAPTLPDVDELTKAVASRLVELLGNEE